MTTGEISEGTHAKGPVGTPGVIYSFRYWNKNVSWVSRHNQANRISILEGILGKILNQGH